MSLVEGLLKYNITGGEKHQIKPFIDSIKKELYFEVGFLPICFLSTNTNLLTIDRVSCENKWKLRINEDYLFNLTKPIKTISVNGNQIPQVAGNIDISIPQTTAITSPKGTINVSAINKIDVLGLKISGQVATPKAGYLGNFTNVSQTYLPLNSLVTKTKTFLKWSLNNSLGEITIAPDLNSLEEWINDRGFTKTQANGSVGVSTTTKISEQGFSSVTYDAVNFKYTLATPISLPLANLNDYNHTLWFNGAKLQYGSFNLINLGEFTINGTQPTLLPTNIVEYQSVKKQITHLI